MSVPLILEQAWVERAFAALGRGEREFFAARCERPPGGDVNLLAAVIVEGHADALQCFVSTFGTKLFVKERSGPVARVATQDPCLCLLNDHPVCADDVEANLLEHVLHGKVGSDASDLHPGLILRVAVHGGFLFLEIGRGDPALLIVIIVVDIIFFV